MGLMSLVSMHVTGCHGLKKNKKKKNKMIVIFQKKDLKFGIQKKMKNLIKKKEKEKKKEKKLQN